MPQFVLEHFVSESDRDVVARCDRDARSAAEAMRRDGVAVRYLSSIFVPEDETCFFLYEAASLETARLAARRAGVPWERIAEAEVLGFKD